MRTFISIDIPENTRREIRKIQEQLPEFEGKKTEEENLHLTLKFLGELDEDKAKEVKRRLNEINFKIFETEVISIGFFSEKFIRIVWLHLSNCEKLQREIDNTLNDLFLREERFMSHLTVARVKNIRDKSKFIEELKKIKIPRIKFLVDKFSLKKSVLTSDGPIYENVREYKIK